MAPRNQGIFGPPMRPGAPAPPPHSNDQAMHNDNICRGQSLCEILRPPQIQTTSPTLLTPAELLLWSATERPGCRARSTTTSRGAPRAENHRISNPDYAQAQGRGGGEPKEGRPLSVGYLTSQSAPCVRIAPAERTSPPNHPRPDIVID